MKLTQINQHSPFCLQNDEQYKVWRKARLAGYPERFDAHVVRIVDPLALSDAERNALRSLIGKTNMAVYQLAEPAGDPVDKGRIKSLGAQMGLKALDSNLCADEDGISSLRVMPGGRHRTYIPYSSRPISWHTDGYYNALDHLICGMILHCVEPAASGGANALLDPEIAYIYLRDTEPAYIEALMQPDVMTIPANEAEGVAIRGAQSGPVFSLQGQGFLHMRYTARTRSVQWKGDAVTAEARACLSEFLDSDSAYIFRYRLEAGQGLISNNVLHTRSEFEDEAAKGKQRLLYRARYFDRVWGT